MRRLLVQFKYLLLAFFFVISLSGWSDPALALSEEQNLLGEAWRIVDRAYVDSSFNHQNWRLIRQNALQQTLLDRAATHTAIQAMLARLDDPFTRLLKPEQYRSLQTTTSGELTGVGLQVSLDSETGELEVITPIAGSPAEKAGIAPQDHILKIDGMATQKLSLDEAAERMRGIAGTAVILTVRHQTNSPQEFSLVRSHIELNPVVANLKLTDSGLKIGYLRLSQFNANAAMEVAHAMERLEKQGAAAYILDLRGNPGGLLQAGIEIARLWLDEGPIVYTVNRQGIESSFEAVAPALIHAPLAVLVNQGTASASEILAGALQDSGRGQLIGEKTFGKGLIQSLFELSDGSGLAVTVAKYETPLHRDIHKQGIQPDLQVVQPPIRRDQLTSVDDLQYQAAVQALTESSVVAGAT
jgi:carboxyl-terminal processing protease